MNRYKGRRIISVVLAAVMIVGGIVPFELGVFAEDTPSGDTTGDTTTYTVTWVNHDGTVLEEDIDVPEGSQPSFDGKEPTKAATDDNIFTFAGWATEANQEEGTPVEELNPVERDITYYAAFSKTARPSKPTFRKITGGFEEIYLEWNKSELGDAQVKYEVWDNGKWVDNGTSTKYTLAFDPYPGKTNGQAASGNKRKSAYAKKANCAVRAYITDPSDPSKKIYSAQETKKGVEVIHPMYVVVKIKRNAKIYKNTGLTKKAGTAKKGQCYVAFGGYRIKGEKKSVIIKVKVNGKIEKRYIKVGDISSFKYVYSSQEGKNYYKGKEGYCYGYDQIEAFINDYDKNYRKKNGQKAWSWSKTKYGIYVDTYHQRLYLLTRSKTGAEWKIAKSASNGTKGMYDLLASTGRQLSPYGGYRVANTMAKKKTTGTKWWLLFNAIGIHEKLSEKLGKPASGGCIRIPDPAAKWYFDHIPKGTGVFIY